MKKILIAIFIAIYFSASGYPKDPLGGTPQKTLPPPQIDPQLIINNYNKASCCLFIDQLKSAKLEKRKKLEFNLHETNDLLDLSTGATFAQLVEIPISSKIEKYVVETNIIHINKDLYVFFPYIALLNSTLNLIGTSDFTHSNYQGQSFFQPTGIMSFSFRVAPNTDLYDDKSVRYLLVYTRKKHFTNKSKEALKAATRSIEAKEVPIEYAGSAGDVIYRDIMYGLPGGRITISNRNRFF